MFLAGAETTAVTKAWVVQLLGRHPAAADAARAEVNAVLSGRSPTAQDLGNLPYTRAVVQEAMRLYPSIYWLPRTAEEDDTLDGVTIPAGKMVALTICAAHRHPDFWTDLGTSDPRRVLTGGTAERQNLAWMPFGTSQRICIGKDVAMLEAQLMLARLFSGFVRTGTRQRADPPPCRPR